MSQVYKSKKNSTIHMVPVNNSRDYEIAAVSNEKGFGLVAVVPSQPNPIKSRLLNFWQAIKDGLNEWSQSFFLK